MATGADPGFLERGAYMYIYSNKKETSDFHGTVSLDLVKLS